VAPPSGRGLKVLLACCLLQGCVIVPYKPKADVEQTPAADVDPSTIAVTASARELIEDVGKAIKKADDGMKVVDPQAFAAVAFLDEDVSLRRLLEPESRARVSEQLAVRYMVLVGEMKNATTDEAGFLLAYLGFYGAAKAVEHTSMVATVIDLENGRMLSGIESEADGLSVGLGYFYGLFVAPMTDWSARDGLARGVAAAIRQSAGAGPLRIAVMSAEERFVDPGPMTPEEMLALKQSVRELSQQLAGQFPQTALGAQGQERRLLIVDPGSVEALQLDRYLSGFLATVTPGETQRPVLHRLHGEPWLTSELWGIDVYRQEAPGVSGLYGYALVTYDAGDIVTAVDAGIFLDAPVHIGPAPSAEARLVKPSIAAGGFELSRDVAGRPVLTASSPQREQALAAYRSTDGCLVVFGSIEQSDEHWASRRRWSDLKLGSVDSGFSGYIVDGERAFEDSAWVLRVSEQAVGNHVLGVEENPQLRAVPKFFECNSGAIVYARSVVRYSESPDPDGEVRLAASLSVSSDLEPELANRAVVLTCGEDWLAPH